MIFSVQVDVRFPRPSLWLEMCEFPRPSFGVEMQIIQQENHDFLAERKLQGSPKIHRPCRHFRASTRSTIDPRGGLSRGCSGLIWYGPGPRESSLPLELSAFSGGFRSSRLSFGAPIALFFELCLIIIVCGIVFKQFSSCLWKLLSNFHDRYYGSKRVSFPDRHFGSK
mgnify:CR=1 FL=1